MQKKTTILILGAAQFVMVLDTTVMNVSISQVVDDLDTTVSSVQLAITAYALVMAAFMLTGAKLGDMFGRRRIFSIGLAIYGTGSLITALSPNLGPSRAPKDRFAANAHLSGTNGGHTLNLHRFARDGSASPAASRRSTGTA